MLQQPALDAELEALVARAHEAADGLVRADDAMAGHDDRDGIRAARAAHRARGRAQLAGKLAVGAHLPGGNAAHRFPDLQAVMRAREADRKVEDVARIVEVRLELNAREVLDRIAARCLRWRGRSKEANPGHVRVARGDAERGERRPQARLERLTHARPPRRA